METAFGLALRELRRERGLSQEELAAKSDLHRTYISLLERGQKSPSLTTICRLAKALDTRPHQLILTTEETRKGSEGK
jgi:transcriptional regulator with XRE-family HTH domain